MRWGTQGAGRGLLASQSRVRDCPAGGAKALSTRAGDSGHSADAGQLPASTPTYTSASA